MKLNNKAEHMKRKTYFTAKCPFIIYILLIVIVLYGHAGLCSMTREAQTINPTHCGLVKFRMA